MPKKLKFQPEITRVKLNPEQAVLGCDCWEGMGTQQGRSEGGGSTWVCSYLSDRVGKDLRYCSKAELPGNYYGIEGAFAIS